ncbi:MAG: glycosyltransferase family 2 protein [Lachnospiraceae bacterium]
MISRIKTVLKYPIKKRASIQYKKKLEQCFLSYQAYEEKKESNVLVEQYNNEDIRVMTFEECGPDFALSSVKESFLIFVTNKAFLDQNAKSIIWNRFRKNPHIDCIYGNEDEIGNDASKRMNPWYKPEFSIDTLFSYFYFGNVVAIRVASFLKFEWLALEDGFENVYHLILKGAKHLEQESFYHEPYMLYHTPCLEPLGIHSSKKYSYWKEIEDTANPHVSIIIPSKDHSEILNTCLSSIKKFEHKLSYEIIVVDNGSCEIEKENIQRLQKEFSFAYVYEKYEFNFSSMCNIGAKSSTGDYLLFLNDDIELVEEDTIYDMVMLALRPHVGAVGVKLYYPNTTMIQHAGITNLRIGPAHKLQFKKDTCNFYYGINKYTRNVLAVTGAALLVKKEKFQEVGGFDCKLRVAFNDVALCYSLHSKGYKNVVLLEKAMYHHESLSRGEDDSIDKIKRLLDEKRVLYKMHPAIYAKDPYHGEGLSRDLLDINYSYEYQFETKRVISSLRLKNSKIALKQVEENPCFKSSVEFFGTREEWEMGYEHSSSNTYILQGYTVVLGTPNYLFDYYLLLEGTNGVQYMGKIEGVYRPDLEVNIQEEISPLLNGFSVELDCTNLISGTYQIAFLAKDKTSRMKLSCKTNRYLKMK